jgi:hypothetical protein
LQFVAETGLELNGLQHVFGSALASQQQQQQVTSDASLQQEQQGHLARDANITLVTNKSL